ncbi:MAG: leucyl aminopeptidase family protein [Pseudomonadota bacterium]
MTIIKLQTLTETEFSPWLTNQSPKVQSWAKAAGFTAGSGQTLLLPDDDGTVSSVLCGAGGGRDLWTLGGVSQKLGDGRYELDEDWDEPSTRQMAVGFLLGQYQFTRYRAPKGSSVELVLPEAWAEEVESQVQATALVRDLVNTPAEHMGPAELAHATEALAEEFAADVEQVVGDDLLTRNYPAIHIVGRAAEKKPRLIRLRWGKPSDPLVVLVGKGVCFDSGGLNMKNGAGMALMKKDMGGAAHVLGVARLIMQHKLPIQLKVLISAVENAVSGNAYRPGDVIATRKGSSIEIGNTDAEGRLVMSDALTLACEMSAELIIDFATLTGAARVAMGPDVPPFFTNHDGVAEDLLAASAAVQDPLWRLPLYQPYREMLKSSVADMNNVGGSAFAGCITAALFLEHFVTDNIPWVHIDTYAWNQANRPGRPKGGEALGMRAVFELLRKRYAPPS